MCWSHLFQLHVGDMKVPVELLRQELYRVPSGLHQPSAPFLSRLKRDEGSSQQGGVRRDTQ